jgi:hypothetical protein
MSQRIIFGGPSELFLEDYPTHPSLVSHGYGEHSTHNSDYHHYAGSGGGVAYAQEMPASAQRDLVYNATQDMVSAFERDKVPKKKQPGAMGSYLAEGSLRRESSSKDDNEDTSKAFTKYTERDVRRGNQIYLGSSMKQKGKGDYEVALESNLYDQLAPNHNQLPQHRRNFQCAEPGLISDHRYNNASCNGIQPDPSYQGGRFYVEDRQGTYLPPCGHSPEYGCGAMCTVTGDKDLGNKSG